MNRRKVFLFTALLLLTVALAAVLTGCGPAKKEEKDGHIHSFTEWKTTATCTEAGKKTRTCKTCGLRESEDVPALGHKITGVPQESSTCTTHGHPAYKKCERCDYTDGYSELPLLPHDTEHHAGQAATCTENGWGEYDTCKNCSYTTYSVIPAAHNYDASGFCAACGTYRLNTYSSTYGYESLAGETHAEGMQALYRAITDKEQAIAGKKDTYTETVNAGGEDFYVMAKIDCSSFALTPDEAQKVGRIFRHDNPAFFWMSDMIYTLELSGTVTEMYLLTDADNAVGENRANSLSSLLAFVDAKADEARYLPTDYERALLFHDAILAKADYAYKKDGKTPEDGPVFHSPVGVLTGRAVCEGFAKTYQMLLNAVGIENIFVAGYGNASPHAWNLVSIDGAWYWCDLTWDDDPDWEWGIRYNYFLVTDTEDISRYDAGAGLSGGARDFLRDHVPYGTKDDDFAYTLPSVRAQEPYRKDGCVRSAFTKGGLEYAVAGDRIVQLTGVTDAAGINVTVPETVENRGVTYTVFSIGKMEDRFFVINASITGGEKMDTIALPKTIGFIWDNALAIYNLGSITVDAENPYFAARDGVLFTKNFRTLICFPRGYANGQYRIPDETEYIAYGAFQRMMFVNDIVLGKNLKHIGYLNGAHGYADDMSACEDRAIVKGYNLALIRSYLAMSPHRLSTPEGCVNYDYRFDPRGYTWGAIFSKDGKTLYTVNYDTTTFTVPASVTAIDDFALFSTKELKTLHYEGTVAEWGEITLGDDWHKESAITEIICSDGVIPLT